MTHVEVRHRIECDAETYWTRCFFTEAFNRELYLDKLHFNGFQQLEFTDRGAGAERIRFRRVRIEPSTAGLPAMLKKLVGDKLAYVEEGTLDARTGLYTLRTIPSVFADKATVAGQIRCEQKGGAIDRILSLKIEVRVFGVGSLAEEKIADDVRRSYEMGASFANEFVRRPA